MSIIRMFQLFPAACFVVFFLAGAAKHPSCTVVAYSFQSKHKENTCISRTAGRGNKLVSTAPFAAAAILVAFQIVTPSNAFADTSKTAAQIQINSMPPSAVQLQIGDLPVLGKLLSGTYARLDTDANVAVGAALGNEPKLASVLIRSPPDKVTAIRDLASKGHLEFDVDGILATHFDVDVAATTAGELTIKVTSPLIPALPFKNKASSQFTPVAAAKGP